MGYVIKWDPSVREAPAPVPLTKTPAGPRAEHRAAELALLSEQVEAARAMTNSKKTDFNVG